MVRPRHPFEGRALDVLGATHRKGRLHLVLILPDGSKSLIPADWTDLVSSLQPQGTLPAHAPTTLGLLENLLHARAVTDALLSRLAAVTCEVETKESTIAGKVSESLRSASRRKLPLGNTARRTQKSRDRYPGAAPRQHHPAQP